MVGISKMCEKCGKMFITRSSRSAAWEKMCYECHSDKKRQRSISNMVDKETRKLDSIENRMLSLEEMVNNHVPSIVSAEINNHLGGILSEEITAKLAKDAQDTITDSIQNLIERQIKFEAKIQRQLTTLNNKILKIMNELGGLNDR